jgi:hypothetical protein
MTNETPVEASYHGETGRLYMDFKDATGLFEASIDTRGPDGHYPAMVGIDSDSGSLLPDDARTYALAILRAAEDADRLNAAHFATEEGRS